jgi:RNA polymerase sigma factor (sigma-70 family)
MMQTVGVGELVAAAARGEQAAWNALVQRYLPLVYSIVRRYRLSDKDAEDVSQTVWLRLVEHLDAIREPKALPGWIATTTRHEVLAVLGAKRRTDPIDPASNWILDLQGNFVDLDDELLRAEAATALRNGLAELEPDQRTLLLLLVKDPPVSYGDISRITGMPVGSIGPTRARCLKKLKATSSVQAFLLPDRMQDRMDGGQR